MRPEITGGERHVERIRLLALFENGERAHRRLQLRRPALVGAGAFDGHLPPLLVLATLQPIQHQRPLLVRPAVVDSDARVANGERLDQRQPNGFVGRILRLGRGLAGIAELPVGVAFGVAFEVRFHIRERQRWNDDISGKKRPHRDGHDQIANPQQPVGATPGRIVNRQPVYLDPRHSAEIDVEVARDRHFAAEDTARRASDERSCVVPVVEQGENGDDDRGNAHEQHQQRAHDPAEPA